VKWCITGDVHTAGLSSTGQQKLRHAVVGTSDGVVQGTAALVVLEIDVGVELKQRVHGHVEASTYGDQQGCLTTPLTLASTTPRSK